MFSTDVQPSTPPPAPPSRSIAWSITKVFLVLLGVLALAYVLLVATNRSDIPRGTTVLGVDIGGQSVSDATTTLQRELVEATVAAVTVEAAGRTIEVAPPQAGLSLDAHATALSAEASTWNPIDLFMAFLREPKVEPIVAVDDAALTAAVSGIATQVDQAVVEGAVDFQGATVVTVEPVPGRQLDQEQAKQAISDAYLVTDETVELAVDVTEPTIGPAEVARALADFANPAVSRPLTLALGDRARVDVDAATLVAYVDLVPTNGVLSPTLDVAGLRVALGSRLAPAEAVPVNARFDLSSGAPAIVPSQDGTSVTDQALHDAVLAALPVEDDRVAEVALQVTPPALTTAQAEALGVREQVSTFTTRHAAGQARVTNIHRAADTLDGTLVLPGETFSLNGVLGERTAAKGYVEAPAILNGRLTKDHGGGVSQLATTTFNAVFFAGLKDVYHKPHSFYISRYPVGREATVDYPSVDLKWTNDSPYGVVIDTSYTGSSITVTFWSTKVYDIEAITGPRTNVTQPETIYDASAGCVSQSPAQGFTVVVTRVFKQGGVEVKREDFKTTYIPEDRVYCQPRPAPAPPAPPAPVTPPPA